MGTSHLSMIGCQLAQPWLAFLLLWQPRKSLPAFDAMKHERPALMTPPPDVPSLVKHLRGVGLCYGGWGYRAATGHRVPLQEISSSPRSMFR